MIRPKEVRPGDQVTLDFGKISGACEFNVFGHGREFCQDDANTEETGYYAISRPNGRHTIILLHPGGNRYVTDVPVRAIRSVRPSKW